MRSGLVVVAAVALLAALAGCTPEPHAPTTPAASSTPIFTSDAAALKAAEAAYAAYEAAVDKSLQTGSTTGLDSVAVDDALKKAKASVASFRAAGQTQNGFSKISNVREADFGSITESGQSKGVAQIYACLDVSKVDVVDDSGATVSSSGRQTVFPTLVSLRWEPSRAKLLVSEETVWDGTNFCA